MMSVQTCHEYAREISARYLRSSKKEKSRILDEFARACQYNRKYALTLLRNPPPPRNGPIPRPRAGRYGKDVQKALAQVRECSDRLCAKRLVPFMEEIVTALERHNELVLSQATKTKLFLLSPATADR